MYPALLAPLPGILVTLIHKDYKYIVSGFPQSFCVPSDGDLAFYSSHLLVNILLATAVCLLIVIIWVVHKVLKVCTLFTTVVLQWYYSGTNYSDSQNNNYSH